MPINCVRTKNNLEIGTKKSIALEWKGEGAKTLFAGRVFTHELLITDCMECTQSTPT